MSESKNTKPAVHQQGGAASLAAAIECTGANGECKNVLRMIAAQVDQLQGQIDEHTSRLVQGDEALRGLRDLLGVIRAIEKSLTVLETRFAIIWAGLGIVGTMAIGSIIAALVALLGGKH